MKFALNRLDMSGPQAFAASAARAEALGWSAGLLPCNPLKVPDPYVSLAFAARETSTLTLGTLLDTPAVRHPSVLAGSIATVAALAPGRVQIGLGIGDSAVRLNGLAPARLRTLREATVMTRALLRGERLEVGALKPARLTHAQPAEVWVAAQGPKTLHMAGACADGVWIRVGRDASNLQMAWDAVCAGADEARRDVGALKIGLILHTAVCDDMADARLMGKAIAAGYYEFSPALFQGPGLSWEGSDPHTLRERVYPDFHHHRDPVFAGQVAGFLDDAAADAFALFGDFDAIAGQLAATLADAPFTPDYVLPHPVLPQGAQLDYMSACARELIPHFS